MTTKCKRPTMAMAEKERAVAAAKKQERSLVKTCLEILTEKIAGAAENAVREDETDIVELYDRIVAAERERCAKLIQNYGGMGIGQHCRNELARAIRREEKP